MVSNPHRGLLRKAFKWSGGRGEVHGIIRQVEEHLHSTKYVYPSTSRLYTGEVGIGAAHPRDDYRPVEIWFIHLRFFYQTEGERIPPQAGKVDYYMRGFV